MELPRLIYEATQRGATPRDVMDIIRRCHQLIDSGAMQPQSFDPNRSSYVSPIGGITAQEAADALASVFGPVPRSTDSISDSSDGINPCGYEEL